MKLVIYVLIALFSFNFSQGQNLILNGSFEQYSGCPTAGGGVIGGQFDSVLFWMNPAPYPPGGSPEYFNACAGGSLNVPNTLIGYQHAYDGVAFCGIGLGSVQYPEFREYIEAPLISPLVVHNCYYFEMYISAANGASYVTDDIQVYFSDTAIVGIPNWNTLPFTPQISNPTGNFPDSSGWTLVSGSYTATGGENFMLIGNFKNDSNTTFVLNYPAGPIYNDTYVFIDYVSLSICTGLPDSEKINDVKIYPSLFSDHLNISVKHSESSEIILLDVESRIALRKQFTSEILLNTEFLMNGIYIYMITNKSGIVSQGKVVKY